MSLPPALAQHQRARPLNKEQAYKALLEAALDQHQPSAALGRAVNRVLTLTDHLLAVPKGKGR